MFVTGTGDKSGGMIARSTREKQTTAVANKMHDSKISKGRADNGTSKKEA